MNQTRAFKLNIYPQVALLGWLLLLCFQPTCGQKREQQQQQLRVGETTRTYVFHVPATYQKTQPVPLVFVLHGGGSQGKGASRLSAMSELAERENFIVVYPDGINQHWNDGRATIRVHTDDVTFIGVLLEYFAHEYNIDRKRVYATGISNGGMMAQRLACEMSDRIAAVVSVAAAMPQDLQPKCKPLRPISVMLINGTDDPLVPYNGGEIGKVGGGGYGGKVLSSAATIKFWLAHDNCSTQPVSERLPDTDPNDGTRVRRDVYGKCKDNREAALYTIEGGGHAWAGSFQYLPEHFIGKTSRDINASETIWDFFKRQQK
ncbi:MAG: PHB depolymerase family esterase [Pyrinomonadaceae bacterium]